MAAAVLSAWGEAEARAAALVRRATGKTPVEHVVAALKAGPGVRMLGLGVGAGALAVELVHHHAADAAVECIDSNPEWLEPGRARAAELGVTARFAAADLEALVLEATSFDVVFCHATLHRVVALEAAADQIKRALRPGGALVVVEVVTRNGYGMWPETREVARAMWRTLPARFRLNHTAYTAPLIDAEIWEPEANPQWMVANRTQDILPVIAERFEAKHFVPYYSLSRRFFDTMYGPNYDLAEPLDAAIFNWVWELDLHYLGLGQLRPETFFGIYRTG